MAISYFLFFYFLLATQPTVLNSQALAKPGCQEKCGDVEIPYPFGIGPNCSMEGFETSCTRKNGTYKPFASNVEIMDIDLPSGFTIMKNNISWQCYNATTNTTNGSNWDLNLSSTPYGFSPYRFSDVYNKFTAIGCETLAYIEDSNTEMKYQSGCESACVSVCSNISGLRDSSCSGINYCQTTIPKDLNYYQVRFEPNSNVSFSPCSYAALLRSDSFEFKSYVNATNFFDQNNGQVPLVVDWAIRDITCEDAIAKPDYACVSQNSVCINSQNGPGYLCNCTKGYEGNPYLVNGCQDIDECKYPFLGPCDHRTICLNVPGSYMCVCPDDAHNMTYPDNGEYSAACVTGKTTVLWVSISFIGFTIMCAAPMSAFAVFLLNKMHKQRSIKKTRQNNSKRHHDIIFRKHLDISERMTIFGIEQLEYATSKFDETLIVGRGGHGIIYKGILSDQRIVAIKKPKIKDDREIEEFLNEVVILSQLNHKNVVKLFGCCLEDEVPLLVYEFIPNGTLTDHLHVEEGQSLSWNDRLRIILETTRALSYLHSTASVSIFHRDIKTSNILLTDGLIAKLSDFGASRSIPDDGRTRTNTAIQGTLGYLDPEYYHTGRLTTKSDVYSFGIIIIEMLTRRKPLSNIPNGVSLVEYFSSAIREACMVEILDPHIMEEHITELETVATLAQKCVRSNGEERPTMKEVEMRLEVLWSSKHRSAYNWNRDQYLEQQLSLLENQQTESDMSGAYISEGNSMLSPLPR